MLQPDGWGWRARIGVLVPHSDAMPESEFGAMAPEGVSVHGGRVLWGPVGKRIRDLNAARAFADPPFVDDAAEALADVPMHVIAYAFTSSSYLLGADADAALKQRLEGRTKGIPIVIPCTAAVLALRSFGVHRLGLITPPWFSAELTSVGAEYFRSQGFDVPYAASAELPYRRAGLDDVDPGQLYQWVRTKLPATAEALFIGGNGMRAVGAIQALEEDLKRPVLTANQVLFWHALRLAGVRALVSGYGQIFTKE